MLRKAVMVAVFGLMLAGCGQPAQPLKVSGVVDGAADAGRSGNYRVVVLKGDDRRFHCYFSTDADCVRVKVGDEVTINTYDLKSRAWLDVVSIDIHEKE